MYFDDYERERRFHELWTAVKIVRPVHYSLFTFGDSVLPYFLVCGDDEDASVEVTITRGEVRIKRPMIITPDSDRPEFRNFFEDPDLEGMVQFLLARQARFSNLRFDNDVVSKKIVREGVEAVLEKLNKQLDSEEEDQVAILAAPPPLAGIAVMRYAAERVMKSGPDNIQELRERGFLP